MDRMDFSEEAQKVTQTAWKMGFEAAVYEMERLVREGRCKKAAQIIRDRHPRVFSEEKVRV